MPVDSAERLEMLGAALDLLDEGVAVLDANSVVVYWNDAAAALTGHRRIALLSRPCPADLLENHDPHATDGHGYEHGGHLERYSGPAYTGQLYTQKSLSSALAAETEKADTSKPVPATMRHQLGHTFPVMLRRVPLRDAMGKRLGTALLFRPTEEVDGLPHGDTNEGFGLSRSQAEVEDRLETSFHDWKTSYTPFGLLWITVDQAAQMRRTHGRDACEAMLKIVEHRLAHGLRPSEVIGRWGNDEFLVLSHERTPEMLMDHAQHLAGLTRTADFRWWGDRVSLTASIGAAQAVEGDTLAHLMLEAQQAMHASVYAGGNHVTHGSTHAIHEKGEPCSR